VAAGWALDLFRGVQARPYADLEVAVPADRFAEVAACFDDCDFFIVHDGEIPRSIPIRRRQRIDRWTGPHLFP
jgi:hypothetical protein